MNLLSSLRDRFFHLIHNHSSYTVVQQYQHQRQKDIIENLSRQYFDSLNESLFHNSLSPEEINFELLSCLIGTTFSEGLHILYHLKRSLALSGDVCEFGVAQGATSALLGDFIRKTNKNLWLFDSFEGLPQPTEKDILIDDIFELKDMNHYQGTMSYPETVVRNRLAAIQFPSDRTKIKKGFIEDTIKDVDLPETVCFAYIDFDFYLPIITALNDLHHRLAPGGSMIVDDYGFFSQGAETAVQEFLTAYPQEYQSIVPPKSSGHFIILEKISHP